MHNSENIPPSRALLLVGSPKRNKSASFLLGNYLLEQLHEQNLETNTFMVIDILRFKDKKQRFFELIKASDLLIFSQPLYVDSLPYPLIKALEILAEKNGELSLPGKQVLAIFNNGYPEPHHNYVAKDILKYFTNTMGMTWLGFLALGMGGALTPKQFDVLARNPKKALALTARAISKGEPVPDKAKRLMEKKLMPIWLYKYFAHKAWKQQSTRYNCYDQIKARPHTTANPSSSQ